MSAKYRETGLRLSHDFIVRELIDFYQKHSENPAYQRATLDLWEIEAKHSGQYSGAYAAAVREIRAGMPS